MLEFVVGGETVDSLVLTGPSSSSDSESEEDEDLKLLLDEDRSEEDVSSRSAGRFDEVSDIWLILASVSELLFDDDPEEEKSSLSESLPDKSDDDVLDPIDRS